MLRRLAALCLVALAVASAAGATTSLTRSESSLVREMNRVRAANGVRALRVDLRLRRAARSHSEDMMRKGYFAHGAFGARMAAFKVQARGAGENLAWATGSQSSAHGIVKMWLASPGHRANLLSPAFSRLGVGAVSGTFSGVPGATVVTADFAD